MTLHDRHVDRIARGEIDGPENDAARLENIPFFDGQNLVDDSEQGVERGLDGVATSDRDVAVKDFLQNFDVSEPSARVP